MTNITNALPVGFELRGKSYTYKIEKVLGQGSFGITYLASTSVQMQGQLGTFSTTIKVAVKEFFMKDVNGRENSTVTSSSQGDGVFDKYRRKFVNEAKSLASLNHPNIIRVLEEFEANNTVYYTMEYIDGGSLDDLIQRRGALSEDEALRYTRQIASALSYMHSHKMLHLDLKPGNIMLKGNDVVLIDFGLSKHYDENGEPESSTTIGGGTPGYAPIEQANYHEGHGFPVTMDIYALGATMFKMLTGVRPPDSSEILNSGFPIDDLRSKGISEKTIGIVRKAMSPAKKDRYQSVTEMLNALSGSFSAARTDESTVIEDVSVNRQEPTSRPRTAPAYNQQVTTQEYETSNEGGNSSKRIGMIIGAAVFVIAFVLAFNFIKGDNEASIKKDDVEAVEDNSEQEDDTDDATADMSESQDNDVDSPSAAVPAASEPVRSEEKYVAKESSTTSSSDEGRWPFTSYRRLTDDDLYGLSSSDLKIMRNEIYARHGYIFQTRAMKNYFASQPWYTPTTSSVKLSSIEEYNVNFIKQRE